MFTVEEMIEELIGDEGGFVNDPDDKGGATKYGITQRTLSEWYGKPMTVDAVRDLDVTVARQIYRVKYYTNPRIDQLPEKDGRWLTEFTFDGAVNHGPGRAIRFIQQVINAFGVAVVAEDGGIGPMTIGACATTQDAVGLWRFNAACYAQRRMFYHDITQDDGPDDRDIKFLNGWLNRLAEFYTDDIKQFTRER